MVADFGVSGPLSPEEKLVIADPPAFAIRAPVDVGEAIINIGDWQFISVRVARWPGWWFRFWTKVFFGAKWTKYD
jgi:hypothetical protein